ncbi:LysR substrate-binding domain-containing protein [Hyphomicrobium sp. ghe19]|uniref:LysR substrate-binding domain-containing protein n=1 Tax=Hyphomicrobium sp. ghe19 TaxID=2682968 RepID=UPI0013679254|nr:HTH-type transcriptional regulator PgrR [Hyphomicrobium sp. ghe19]
MDRLRAMAAFVAVTEAGSLSAAARSLGEPLTNLSRMISQLEAHLGCTLLHRSTRQMVLTPAGSEYLDTCRAILDTVAMAERRIAGQADELSGDLALTAPVLFGRMYVVPLLAQFLAEYPRINARLLLVDRVVNLLDEGIDIALRIGELPDSALLATRVGSLRLVTCAAPAYLERCGMPSAPPALTQHDCVTFANLPGGTRWIFRSRRNGRKAVRVRSRLSVNTADAAVAAATAGIGITRVLSYQAEDALHEKRLLPILDRFEDTEIPVQLVYSPTSSSNARVRSFVTFAAGKLRLLPHASLRKTQGRLVR